MPEFEKLKYIQDYTSICCVITVVIKAAQSAEIAARLLGLFAACWVLWWVLLGRLKQGTMKWVNRLCSDSLTRHQFFLPSSCVIDQENVQISMIWQNNLGDALTMH